MIDCSRFPVGTAGRGSRLDDCRVRGSNQAAFRTCSCVEIAGRELGGDQVGAEGRRAFRRATGKRDENRGGHNASDNATFLEFRGGDGKTGSVGGSG